MRLSIGKLKKLQRFHKYLKGLESSGDVIKDLEQALAKV